MKFSKYKEVERFLFSQLPMFQRVGPKAFKKDLKNIKKLVALLGQPQDNFKSIHVAGTNGKGSTSFFIASALHHAGYKVGLYTSPHYKDYRERIKINGMKIPKSFVKRFVNRLVAAKVFENELAPSFFEVTVAMAFLYFSEEQVDYAVIEVGLGGRLDSTNVIVPELSVITNIGYDHMNFLGNTLPKIAKEKAGIIKSKVPVVIGRPSRYANRYKQPDYFKELKTKFPSYQAENLTTAFAALSQLKIDLKEKDFKRAWSSGLNDWGYMGRYQLLSKRPRVLCDSAHNKMGLSKLFEVLKEENYKKLHVILAMVGDKDLDMVLPLFPQEAVYYFSQAKIPRAKKAAALQSEAAQYLLEGKTYSTVGRALAAAKRKASAKDLILVTGSIFTVAEVV